MKSYPRAFRPGFPRRRLGPLWLHPYSQGCQRELILWSLRSHWGPTWSRASQPWRSFWRSFSGQQAGCRIPSSWSGHPCPNRNIGEGPSSLWALGIIYVTKTESFRRKENTYPYSARASSNSARSSLPFPLKSWALKILLRLRSPLPYYADFCLMIDLNWRLISSILTVVSTPK